MASIGALQVSIVEGRNLKSLEADRADPFVSLQLGNQEVKTDAIRSSLAPKWVKDFKLSVPSSTSQLKVTVYDDYSRSLNREGVMGSFSVPLEEIISAGTQVQWYKVKDTVGAEVGEICLVLRYIPSATAPAPAPAPAPQPAAASVSTTSSVSTTTVSTPAPPPPAPRPAPAVHSNSASASDSKAAASTGEGDGNFWTRLVLGVAGVAAVVLGVGVLAKGKAKHQDTDYVVKEGDTLCYVGHCFKTKWPYIYKKNEDTLRNPDVIYPGQRLVIPQD
eukprot:jgi/Chlat1/608/Chrsp103S01031